MPEEKHRPTNATDQNRTIELPDAAFERQENGTVEAEAAAEEVHEL